MSNFFFKNREGQTPLSSELKKGLKISTIQNMGELDEHEEANIAKGLVWLEKKKRRHLDYDFWLKLHEKLLKDVWSWAGEIRSSELDNPDFLRPIKIREAIKSLIDNIKYWIENNTFPKEEIAARLHERLLTIHPFPNGNGRWSRILTEYFCKEEKIRIPTWGKSLESNQEERRKNYIEAIEAARKHKNFQALIDIMFN